VPVCFVSAKTGAGVAELLNVLIKLARIPAEGNPPLFYKGEGEAATEFRSEPDPKKHVLAHVFKVVMDPFVGKLGIFRVHQGTVTKDTQLFVGDGRKPVQGRASLHAAGRQERRDRARRARRHRGGRQGGRHRLRLRAPRFARRGPHPHAAARIPDADAGSRHHAAKRGDEQRISEVLHRMIAEDPTLVVEHDPTTNETVLRALGDLHLRLGAGADGEPVQARSRYAAAAHSLPRDDHREGGRIPSP
jgi:elongation factor G